MEIFRARKRETLGKQVKDLRQRGVIPAVLYGRGQASIPLELDRKEFLKTYQTVGESSIAKLLVGEIPFPVLISGLERDPRSLQPIHIDFRQIAMDEEITTTTRLKIVGEAPAAKSGAGMLLTLVSELEVECLPEDLPAAIEVDVSRLETLDAGILIKDLPIDFSKIKVLGHQPDDLVVKIGAAEMEEVEEVAPEAAVEAVEITAEKGKPEEGAAVGGGETSEVTSNEAPAS